MMFPDKLIEQEAANFSSANFSSENNTKEVLLLSIAISTKRTADSLDFLAQQLRDFENNLMTYGIRTTVQK